MGITCLSVGLGHTLQLVLLLDGVAVGAALGGVDELVGQALRDGLDVPEGGLAGASAQQPDGLEMTGFFPFGIKSNPINADL